MAKRNCEICGKPIDRGIVYCSECRAKKRREQYIAYLKRKRDSIDSYLKSIENSTAVSYDNNSKPIADIGSNNSNGIESIEIAIKEKPTKYTCSNCGTEITRQNKECPGCGEILLWDKV